jgi:hypothetical protein
VYALHYKLSIDEKIIGGIKMNETLTKLARLSAFVEASMKAAEAEDGDTLSDRFVYMLQTTYSKAKDAWNGIDPLDVFADQLVMNTGRNFPKDLFLTGFKTLNDTINKRVELEISQQARLMAISKVIIENGGIHIEEE